MGMALAVVLTGAMRRGLKRCFKKGKGVSVRKTMGKEILYGETICNM